MNILAGTLVFKSTDSFLGTGNPNGCKPATTDVIEESSTTTSCIFPLYRPLQKV